MLVNKDNDIRAEIQSEYAYDTIYSESIFQQHVLEVLLQYIRHGEIRPPTSRTQVTQIEFVF